MINDQLEARVPCPLTLLYTEWHTVAIMHYVIKSLYSIEYTREHLISLDVMCTPEHLPRISQATVPE